MNQLDQESSPYLLQHKDNPVHWMPWGNEAFKKAVEEKKLMIVSIGYSSCHWCHVMEKEVFEDYECAELMNMHFVCIKVDREERPDVDHYYMDAVHLMGGRGGWPLNAFALPDGRPVYGGTYFPKKNWIDILEKLAELYNSEPERMIEYANSVASGLSEVNRMYSNEKSVDFELSHVGQLTERWSKSWDKINGGISKAPKFPMPDNWQFLLQYSSLSLSRRNALHRDSDSDKYHSHLILTLNRIAHGGLFDHIGGGFYRYSVDAEWKIPHFEKMLYDNAQLISLYSNAYKAFGDHSYLNVALQTLEFLDREMSSDEGLYYSALDADSEGEEGKYYVWTEDELRSCLNENEFVFAVQFFSVGKEAHWEHGKNHLLNPLSLQEFVSNSQRDLKESDALLVSVRSKLLNHRSQRVRPSLDYKCITSWNALMIRALADISDATADKRYLEKAVAVASAIEKLLCDDSRNLFRIRTSGKTTIPGFLDDYAFLIRAYLSLYNSGAGERWYHRATELLEIVQRDFSISESALFKLGRQNDTFSAKVEVQDNVIPSANACLAECFYLMSQLNLDSSREKRSTDMVNQVMPSVDYASGYSHWLQVFILQNSPFYELAITGDRANEFSAVFRKKYLPQTVIAASTTESELPLLKDKIGTVSAIYVCTGKTCFPPAENPEAALKHIQ